MNRKPLIAVITALGLGSATGAALAYDLSDIRAMDAAKITLEQAIETAKKEHQGSRVLKAEIETHRDKGQYEVKLLTNDKRVYEVYVDAETGAVLLNREDHDD